MSSFYSVLGIEESASLEDVKRAYRKKALDTHPDKNTGVEGAQEAFRAVSEAYEVLRDEHKRAAYDAQRRGGGSFGTGSPAAAASGAWRPGASGFDEAFASWFERQGFVRNTEEKINEQILKERREAERMARAAAWEAEKAEAQANRERFERVIRRARTARAVRHARVLSRFWHTSQGLIWQDALVVAMLGLSVGLSTFQLWPSEAVRQQHSGQASADAEGGDGQPTAA